jgi:hypothetical protein
MSKISSSVVKFSKQKSIPAIVVDVVGRTCTVSLSGRGGVLHNVVYIGPTPTAGDPVFVNYVSGRPVVETSSGASVDSQISKAVYSIPSSPSGSGSGDNVPTQKDHNSLANLQGGNPSGISGKEYYHLTAAQNTIFSNIAGVPNANAILDLISTTKAFMPPRMSTTQRDAIPTPTEGMIVYNLTTHAINFYNGTIWKALAVV